MNNVRWGQGSHPTIYQNYLQSHITLYTHQTNIGKDVEQKISYTDGSINWYNHFGKQLEPQKAKEHVLKLILEHTRRRSALVVCQGRAGGNGRSILPLTLFRIPTTRWYFQQMDVQWALLLVLNSQQHCTTPLLLVLGMNSLMLLTPLH